MDIRQVVAGHVLRVRKRRGLSQEETREPGRPEPRREPIAGSAPCPARLRVESRVKTVGLRLDLLAVSKARNAHSPVPGRWTPRHEPHASRMRLTTERSP